MDRQYYAYFLASRKHGTLYIRMTNDLVRRVYQHKEKLIPGFTKKYDISKLVYYEVFNDPYTAIAREKQLKKWQREWKIRTMRIRIGTTCRSISETIVVMDSGTRATRSAGMTEAAS
jgi:putative endonuclease